MNALQWKQSKEISVFALHLSMPNCERHLGIHVKCPIFLFDVSQIWDFSADLLKFDNVKFPEKMSSRVRAHIYVEKLTEGFRNRLTDGQKHL